MVQAMKVVLIRCDVPTKVFIQTLDESSPTSERFVIDKQGLDDCTILVKPNAVDFIREELRKHKDSITYVAPVERKF